GGDAHGAGALPNAANVTVGRATIHADAINHGDGGKLVVWSNGITDFSGIVSAMGGAQGGNGGFVETSGHELHIAANAHVVTKAPHGKTGAWLLDPDKIVIANGGTTTIPPDGTLPVGQDPGATDTIAPATIIAALGSTNVTLEAVHDIDVNSAVVYASGNTLSLLAGGNIDVLASIQNSQVNAGGGINLIAGWNQVTLPPASLTASGVFGNNGGAVTIGGGAANVAVGSASGLTAVAGVDVSVTAARGYAQLGFHGAGGGAIDVVATGDITATGGTVSTAFAQIGNGSRNGDVNGDITGDISTRAGGNTNFNNNTGIAWFGNSAASGSTETGNVTAITSGGFFRADFVSADLGTAAGTGGNVFLG